MGGEVRQRSRNANAALPPFAFSMLPLWSTGNGPAAMHTDTFHPSYDPAQEHAWHLSFWLSPGLQAWSVHERSSGRLVGLASGPNEDLPLPGRLPVRPSSVSFTAMPEVSALVPESAMEPGSGLQHLKLVHGKVPTGLLRDEPVDTLGAHCIYLHDEQAELNLLKRFPGARSLPLQGTLISHALGRSASAPVAVVHRAPNRVDLVVADHGRLLLSNTFFATTPEDVLYYTLFAVEQCGLAPGDIQLRTGGTHLTAADEHLLADYFTSGPVPTTGKADPVLSLLALPDAHRWTGLIEQFPCAS